MTRLTPTRETIVAEYDVRTDDAVENQRPICAAARGLFKPTSAAVVYNRTAGTYVVELTGPCVDARYAGYARRTGSTRERPDMPIVTDVVTRVISDFSQEPLP
jgi:hypothetical protein